MSYSDFLKAKEESNSYKALNEFENEIIKLQRIPEKNWFDRYVKAKEIIISYINESDIKQVEKNIDPNHYLVALKFDYLYQTYLLFEDVTFSRWRKIPTHNWFQLERQDKSFGETFYKTILLLSSDDNAKTQGGLILQLFDQK
jgi:hypothetical protein